MNRVHSSSHRPLKAALFGWYGYGNFGDDLMAVIFGLFLWKHKVEFSVYKLCRPIAEQFKFTVVDSVEDLIDGKDIVILGGGGIFQVRKKIQPRMLKFAQELSDLIALTQQKNIPIYGFSLGGNGVYCKPLEPPGRQALLEQAKYISVRNPEDMDFIRYSGCQGAFYPDVLWQTPLFFPVTQKKNARLKIGINIFLGQKMPSYFPKVLDIITRIRRDLDFVFIDSYNQSKTRNQALKATNGAEHIGNYTFYNLTKDIELISSLDLVISSRLHLGLVGMSYGVPFLSLFGGRKTKLMLHSIGLGSMYLGQYHVFNFFLLMLSKKKLFQLVQNFKVPDENTLKNTSLGHMQKLNEVLARHRESNG